MPGEIMFAKNTYAFSFLLLVVSTACAEEELSVTLADPAWNGKNIPVDQVCNKFGGIQAKSPALKIEGIPADADALLLSFNDESYAPMDKGGHGVVLVQLKNSSTAQVQSIPGETDMLPTGISVVKKHRGTGWSGTGGAYLPPCSGGRGNKYSIDISAIKGGTDGSGTTVAKGKIVIGSY